VLPSGKGVKEDEEDEQTKRASKPDGSVPEKGYPKKIAGAPGYYSMTLANTYKNKQLSKITGTPDHAGLGWTCSVKLKKMSVPSDYAAVITGQQRQILLNYVCRLPLETVPMGGI